MPRFPRVGRRPDEQVKEQDSAVDGQAASANGDLAPIGADVPAQNDQAESSASDGAPTEVAATAAEAHSAAEPRAPSPPPSEVPAAPAPVGTPLPAAAPQAVTQSQPAVPAGQEPVPPPDPGAGFGHRGQLRRRLRFLRRARELALRDLGGLVFDMHRFGRTREDLVAGKVGTLTRIDGELRALEAALDDVQPVTVLREPGITACPRCAAIHGTEANFCPNCGLPFGRHAQLPVAAAVPLPAPAAPPAGAAPPPVAAPPSAAAPPPAGAMPPAAATTPAPATPAPDAPATPAEDASPDAPTKAFEPPAGEPQAGSGPAST